ERALACAIRLLDRGFFRIGSEGYTEQNKSYGLATMLKEHVTLSNGKVIFEFVGKSGKEQVKSVVDPLVFATVAALKRRRGGSKELLAYKIGNTWIDVKSIEINEYLKDVAGDDYSAKDFRTWHATELAAIGLAVSYPTATSKTARKRAISRMVKEVALSLGNTPAVARRSYIDPVVIDKFEHGITIGGTMEMIGDSDPFDFGTLGVVETAVLDLLRGDKKSVYLDKVA
ncbi:MAG: DNA topoisomerase IB, partial [Actinobacteria bacterium]|nr:DNA topoisomerase IB [Actinomycetota bacterium]